MQSRTRYLLIAMAVAGVAIALLMLSGQREPVQIDSGRDATVGNLTLTDPTLGTGNLTVFLFEDYQCSHCIDYALGTNFQHLLETWVVPGDITLVFRHAAFVAQHSLDAAIASRCVHAIDADSWSEWDHELYAMQAQGGTPDRDALRALAQHHGVAGPSFEECIASDVAFEQVRENTRILAEEVQHGTPALVVGGLVMNPNDTDAVDAAIRDRLEA